ncbi:NACHT domain-containing protein [Micromonospora sp. WMMD712]|uniref:NACHT domain-containing protein n=1 Tax=Micromonospora sp. WMMD712 TaxID=3016096 RepID=UPI00249CD79B|nr:NACHT domain-containing protein [Micromonospora sp. WMMD712]WFE60089.1 NACHT domain-containing protein [Micromonospora sp. WMMD712]
MTIGGEEAKPGPAQTLASALRELHSQAGAPSARALAKQIGTVSHTTVSEALAGRRTPSWPIVASLVQRLAGDEDRFRVLWSAATAESPPPTTPERDDLAFLVRYRQRAAQRHRASSLPWLHHGRADIVDLYVPQRIFVIDRSGDPGPSATTDTWRLDGPYNRAVLLAGPGGGKSAFCAMLTHRHAIDDDLPVPFLVPIRDFAAEIPLARSVVGFVEHRLETLYQLQPPEGFIERQLATGNALILFDGLDEVPLPSHRALISSVIDLLADDYPRARILVTSRPVGYERQALDPARFAALGLADLDEGEIRLYAHRWFVRAVDVSPDDAEQMVGRFMEESASVGELRSNPLQLSLLCDLYRRLGHLPRSGPELYQAYWQSRLDWDVSRGIKVVRHPTAVDMSALGYLAFWMLSHGAEDWTISRATLLKVIGDFLSERTHDRDSVEHAARLELEFLQQRAAVIVHRGRTSDGDEAYGFFHRTFMEFCAANHLARTVCNAARVAQELAPRLDSPEWENVGMHAVQIAGQLRDDGADQVIDGLITEAQNLPAAQRDTVRRFVLRLLDVVDLRPRVALRLAHKANLAKLAVQQPAFTDQPSLQRYVRRWQVSTAVPDDIAERLRTARDLTAQAFDRPELVPVAVAWTWSTLEAALCRCLDASTDTSPAMLIGEATGRGILTPQATTSLKAAYALRSRAVHGGLDTIIRIDSAVEAIEAIHNVISDVHRSPRHGQ